MAKFAFALVAAALCSGQDFDKSKHPWLKHKPGAWVEYKMSQSMGEMNNEGTYKTTLKKVGEKDYVLANAIEMGGQKQETEDTQTLPVKDGEEKVKVGDKEYDCTIWKQSGTRNGEEGEVRFWIAKGQDAPLKFAMKGKQTSFELTAVKINDPIDFKGRKIECVAMTGKFSFGGGDSDAEAWFTSEIPGGLARMKIKFAMGDQEGSVTMVAVDSGEKEK